MTASAVAAAVAACAPGEAGGGGRVLVPDLTDLRTRGADGVDMDRRVPVTDAQQPYPHASLRLLTCRISYKSAKRQVEMSDAPIKPIKSLKRPQSLHVSVRESLRRYIEDNHLRAGDPLPPEADLAQQLGVGRNSVREAIKSLESLGVLDTRRGIGVFVKAFSFQPLLENLAYGLQISLREVEELREIRRVLETGLIDKTIARIGDEDIAALGAITERMRAKAEAGASFAEEDQRFHQLLFRCQDNRTLSALIDVFWTAFNKASDFANLANPAPLATWQDHHDIVDAIAARDVELARRRLDAHYSGIQRVLAMNRPAEAGKEENQQREVLE